MPPSPFDILLGRNFRKELGVPDYVSDATLADLMGRPALPPPIVMQPVPTPEQIVLDWAPTAVRVAGGVGGGILAGVGGPIGPLAAGSVNVFADQIARKMEEANQQRVPSAQFESARAPAAFLGGVLQGLLPRATGPLGYVQAGAENAGLNALENAAEGRTFDQRQTAMSALLGPAFHGAFQGGGKAVGALTGRLVPITVQTHAQPPVQSQRVPFSI